MNTNYSQSGETTTTPNAPKRPTVYQSTTLLHFGSIAEITQNNPGMGPDGGNPSAS